MNLENENNKKITNVINDGESYIQFVNENNVGMTKEEKEKFDEVGNVLNEKLGFNEDVLNFAKEQGYESAEYLGEWNEYESYEPLLKAGEISYTGAPLVILVDKNDNIRMSTYDEAMQYLRDSKK